MNVNYKKLFEILEKKNINKNQLKEALDLSSATIAKLSKNEQISMTTLVSICNFLNCQPGDVMEIENKIDENSLLFRLRDEKEIRLKGGIYHQTQIKLAYNSNHIEGSRLTEDQTRYIYETNTIGTDEDPASIDDIFETVNHFQCFDYIIDCANDLLTEDIIKNVHRILKSNTSDSRKAWFKVGDYKTRANIIGDNIKTTHPSKVKGEIENLLYEYQKLKNVTIADIVTFHHNFESIHPFQDGNGRVGRLIIFKECLKHNITPFIIDEAHKMYYYRGLKEFKNEPGYLIDTCLSAQDMYKKLLDYFEISYND